MYLDKTADYDIFQDGITFYIEIADSIDVFDAEKKKLKPQFKIIVAHYTGEHKLIIWNMISGVHLNMIELNNKINAYKKKHKLEDVDNRIINFTFYQWQKENGETYINGSISFCLIDEDEMIYPVMENKVNDDIKEQLFETIKKGRNNNARD